MIDARHEGAADKASILISLVVIVLCYNLIILIEENQIGVKWVFGIENKFHGGGSVNLNLIATRIGSSMTCVLDNIKEYDVAIARE